jgi:hypothetical protein
VNGFGVRTLLPAGHLLRDAFAETDQYLRGSAEELQRRNYSQETTRAYLRTFAKHFHRSPEELGPDHICQHQAHLYSALFPSR